MNDETPIRPDDCAKTRINETAKALAEDLGIDNPLMISDQGPAPSEGDVGVVRSVNTSPKKGMRKAPVEAGVIELVSDYGVAEDAHAGDWHRQVSFLAEESIQTAREFGLDVGFGDFAENITTSGINVKEMPLGTLLRVGEALVEVSQIGKVCHTRCAIYYLAGDCIFPREGIFGWVVEPGKVRVGDLIRIEKLGDGHVHRELSDKPRK
jgi:MOSC domain-containing protein YiiM